MEIQSTSPFCDRDLKSMGLIKIGSDDANKACANLALTTFLKENILQRGGGGHFILEFE